MAVFTCASFYSRQGHGLTLRATQQHAAAVVLLVVAAAVASPAAAALLLSDLFTRVCRVIGTLTCAADDPSLLALLHLRHYAKGALTHGK